MQITGYGGKSGSGSSSATEAADTLRSISYAKILDLISEGEIGGLVDGDKSIYFDQTPLQNSDGSYNFSNVTVETRTGTQTQDYLPGFPNVQNEVAVGITLYYNSPYVHSFTDLNLSAVNITLSVASLSQTDTSNGNINATSVVYTIERTTNDGRDGWDTVVNTSFSGKTTSKYSRTHRIELPANTYGWKIRVIRQSPDSTSSYLVNAITLDSYTEVIDAKLRYPMSALVGIQIDASQFSSIPTRSYDMYGRLIKVPTNYDSSTRTYTGAWNGTFKIAYSNNPAWVFYDLVLNDRYGLGDRLDSSQVDKWGLYTIGQYCDEYVSDGLGGTEPRFTCNLYITAKADAYKVIQDLSSIFRGMAYWAGSNVYVSCDKPSDPVYTYTAANVIDGKFTRSGSALKTRYTVALVTWNDPNNSYQQAVEAVQDQTGILKYGVQETQITAFGCTSQGQAHRVGLWALTTSRLETNTITFTVGLDGLVALPGDIVRVADPARMGRRNGGRISSTSGNTVTVDKAPLIAVGDAFTVILPTAKAQTKKVIAVSGNVVTVDSAWTVQPQPESIWSVDNTDLVAPTYKITSISEKTDLQFEITALQHEAGKYDYIESNIAISPQSNTSTKITTPATPTNLEVTESLYLITPTVVGNKISLSWSGNSPSYAVAYRNGADSWTYVNTLVASLDIAPADTGTWEFKVYGVNSVGTKGIPASISQEVYGKTALPNNVTNLNMHSISGAGHFTFDAATDLDVIVGGYLRIRQTPNLTGQLWSNAIDIGTQVAGTSTSTVLPLLSGSYLAKWVDSSGNESSDMAVVVNTTTPSLLNLNIVSTLEQAPSFSGTKTNLFANGSSIQLESLNTIDAMTTLIDTWPSLSIIGGGSAPSGTYIFPSGVDLGSVQTSRLTAALTLTGFQSSSVIDERDYVDTWLSVDGDNVTDAGCTLYVSTSNDNISWSDFTPLVVGEYVTRAFKFKALLYTANPTHNISVTQMSVTIDMPDRTEVGNDIVSGTSTYSVAYSKPFMALPSVGITAQNMQTGDFYTLTAKTTTGFQIVFKNSSGAIVSRTFDYYVKGY